MNLKELPDMTAAYQKVQEKKKERWQDDDGDGKWYEKSDVDGKISKREKEEKKKNQKEEVEQVEEKATPESGTGNAQNGSGFDTSSRQAPCRVGSKGEGS